MLQKTVVTLALLALSVSQTYAGSLKLKSSSLSEGEKLSENQVFKGFGCNGKDLSPALSWSNIPQGTKSLAVTIYDPGAPTGSGWWHWVVFNIPTSSNQIAEGGNLPKGAITLKNDYGKTGFGGACPPPGEVHRYQVTLHALSTVLDLDSSVSNAFAGFMIKTNSIESDTITAVYHR